MTQETQRKIENFTFGLQTTLIAIDDLKSDGFYAQKIKYHSNLLMKEIERLFGTTFKGASARTTDYYIGLNDWMKISSSTFEKFDKLPEDRKIKYLNALANFNTINLK